MYLHSSTIAPRHDETAGAKETMRYTKCKGHFAVLKSPRFQQPPIAASREIASISGAACRGMAPPPLVHWTLGQSPIVRIFRKSVWSIHFYRLPPFARICREGPSVPQKKKLRCSHEKMRRKFACAIKRRNHRSNLWKNTSSIRLCTIHRNAACMASSSSSDGRKWLVLLFWKNKFNNVHMFTSNFDTVVLKKMSVYIRI